MSEDHARKPLVVLHAGEHARLVRRGRWEYVERVGTTGIVAVAALTDARCLLLVEQFRPPLNARVIELPAGLAGDLAEFRDEPLTDAAHRELLEETGYSAEHMNYVTHGPLSAGMTTEIVTVFMASGLTRVNAGGGDESEDIVVHEVPLGELEAWVMERMAAGVMVDPKVFAAAWFLSQDNPAGL